MQNMPNATNSPKKIKRAKPPKKKQNAIQLQTALNITFDEKVLNSLKAKQLEQQAKFRGIPLSNRQKHFTTEEIRKFIYKYDTNITHMTNKKNSSSHKCNKPYQPDPRVLPKPYPKNINTKILLHQ